MPFLRAESSTSMRAATADWTAMSAYRLDWSFMTRFLITTSETWAGARPRREKRAGSAPEPNYEMPWFLLL